MLCQNLRSRRSGRVSAAADASFNPAAADIGIGGSSSSSSSSEEDTAPNTVSVSMSGHEKMGSGIGSGGGGAEYETSLGLVPQHRQQHEFISATTTANSFGYNPMHSLNSQFYRASIHMQPSYPYNHHAQHNRNQNHQPHATPTYTVPSYSADGYTASQPAETSSTFYAPSAYQHPPPHHQDPEYDDEPDGESSNEFGKRPAPREPSSGFYGARRDSTASATSARGGRGAGGASTRNLHKRVKRGNDGGDSKDPKFCFSDQIVKMGDVSYQIVYRRPPISYADLITYAITQTESKRLKLQSIYTFLTSTFGYFRYNPQKRGWEVKRIFRSHSLRLVLMHLLTTEFHPPQSLDEIKMPLPQSEGRTGQRKGKLLEPQSGRASLH
ncbi:hypothetical protein BC830DRAFT_931501 [Chytriomyces sp. MP71]|nr:hypothetical protein BC830DRAFT_931501 [Chytriomyces sp. MP71]